MPLLEPLSRCLYSSDDLTVQDACAAFALLTEPSETDDTEVACERLEVREGLPYFQYCLACDVVAQLVSLLGSGEEKIRFSAIQVLGNIVAFRGEYLECKYSSRLHVTFLDILDNGVLEACLPLLGRGRLVTSKVEKEVCSMLLFVASDSLARVGVRLFRMRCSFED